MEEINHPKAKHSFWPWSVMNLLTKKSNRGVKGHLRKLFNGHKQSGIIMYKKMLTYLIKSYNIGMINLLENCDFSL